MEVPSVAAPPSRAPARAAEPASFVERALANQRGPLGPPAAGAAASPGAGLGFGDLLDIVNPLQHVPIVSAAYRSITGDQIAPMPRLLGGALFGGLIGLAFAAADAALAGITGRDAGEHLVTALFGGSDPSEPEAIMVASADSGRATARPAPPATADGPAQPPAAQAQPGAPRPWYVAGRERGDNEFSVSAPAAAPDEGAPVITEAAAAPDEGAPVITEAAAAPDEGAPGALAAAEPGPAPPEPAARLIRAGGEPLSRYPASVVSRLTPAQVELLLASVGQHTSAEVLAQAGIPPGAAAASPAGASGETGSPKPSGETRPPETSRDGRGPASGPIAGRIRHGLEAYRSAGGLLASGPGAGALR